MKGDVLILFILCLSFTTKAQDPQFSQFYSAPMYLNPAFAGNTTQGRIMGNYRNQWPAIPKAFVSYSFAYDHNLSDYSSGVGAMVVHDKAGTGGLTYTSVGGMYSYQFKLSRKVIVRPGLRASYVFRGIDASKLTFPDQLSSGGGVSSSETGILDDTRYLDIAAGIVIYSKDYWAGFSIDHINQPNQSLIQSGSTKLPAKYSFHGGYNYPLQKNAKGQAKSMLTIAANYKAQLKWDQFDVGAYYTQEPLVLGLWYRGIPVFKSYDKGYANNDAIIALIGFKAKDVQIGYSYDLTISRLLSNTAGAHEVSLVYEYATEKKRKKKKKQKFLVPCAKF